MTKLQGEANTRSGRSNKLSAILLFISAVIVLGVVGIRLFSDAEKPLVLGGRPRDFSLIPFSGSEINTADLRGKVILVNFWASWCTSCKEEAEMLEEAWKAYQSKGLGDVVFVGVAYKDTEPESLAFLSKYGVTYPNGLDAEGEISTIYQVTGVPETYILDSKGFLDAIKIGPFVSKAEIHNALDAVLGAE